MCKFFAKVKKWFMDLFMKPTVVIPQEEDHVFRNTNKVGIYSFPQPIDSVSISMLVDIPTGVGSGTILSLSTEYGEEVVRVYLVGLAVMFKCGTLYPEVFTPFGVRPVRIEIYRDNNYTTTLSFNGQVVATVSPTTWVDGVVALHVGNRPDGYDSLVASIKEVTVNGEPVTLILGG